MRTANIKLTAILVISFLISVNGMAQKGTQKRVIQQNDMLYGISIDNEGKSLVLEIQGQEKLVSLKTPAWNYGLLENNPIPWFQLDEMFYYVSIDNFFKGSYSLRINEVGLIEEDLSKKEESISVRQLDANPNSSFYLPELHSRKFNKEDLRSLFYDFTVINTDQLVLASYFDGKLCVYQSVKESNRMNLCGCAEVEISAPFNIFLNENDLCIQDRIEKSIQILIEPEVEIIEREIIINSIDDSMLRKDFKDKIGEGEFLLIKNTNKE